MPDLINQLVALEGYHYSLWQYTKPHSTLILRATHTDKPKHNIHLVFTRVLYVQMPVLWTGDLALGSESEFIEIAQRAGTKSSSKGSYEVLKQASWDLFKAKSSDSVIYILGHLANVEQNVEPVY